MGREQTIDSLLRRLDPKLPSSTSSDLQSLGSPPQKLQSKHREAVDKYNQEMGLRDDQLGSLPLDFQHASHFSTKLEVAQLLLGEAIRHRWEGMLLVLQPLANR
jgi:hypothetical protein